ncbi:MAG: MFS transporter [Hyphomonadaceae bacterium]|nr:MFS transporter [Hyphomonadaceae bacterium]
MTQASKQTDPPFWRVALFALPGAPLLALSVPPIVFLPRYYATELGVEEGVVGLVFLAARLFDVIVNPTIGTLQDRTRTPFGRRRVWLVAATPLLMAIVWFAFIGMPPGVGAIFVGLTVMSLYITFAGAMIAHLGWAGECAPTYHGRTRVLGVIQIASALGQVAMMATPAVVQMTNMGDFADGVHLMGWMVIIALPICVAIAVWAMPETIATTAATTESGFAASIRALFASAVLRRVLVPDLLIGIVQGMAGTLFLFYADAVLNIEREATSLLFVYFFSGLVAIPFWVWLGRRIGKHTALAWSCVLWASAFAVFPIVPPNAPEILAIGMLVAGFPSTAGTLLVRSMMADAVDDDEARTGEQRSGLYFGLLLTTSKVGLAFGPASLALLSLFGFNSDPGVENSPLALAALTWLYCGTPALLMAVTFLSLRNYPLDEKRQGELRAQIDARRTQGAAAAD